ncbi:MAG: LPS export ABC transporter periplasmic protein LptC [Pseudomonadota bacterium]|nr:LPS export ABC transporter periplasmic protein LptC [Pseudomonadota bacterium]
MHKRTAHRWRLGSLMMVGAVFALASFWLVQVINRGELPGPGDAPKSEPDYIVEKFSFVRMTPDGKPRYIVSGDKLIHRPEGDVSDIDRPVVQKLSPAPQPMTVTANTARIVQSSNVVDLFGNVNIERPAGAAGPHMRLKTEALTILSDQDQMKTAAPVEMISGTTTLTGVGMFADSASRKIDIASRVHITYPPAPRR